MNMQTLIALREAVERKKAVLDMQEMCNVYGKTAEEKVLMDIEYRKASDEYNLALGEYNAALHEFTVLNAGVGNG